MKKTERARNSNRTAVFILLSDPMSKNYRPLEFRIFFVHPSTNKDGNENDLLLFDDALLIVVPQRPLFLWIQFVPNSCRHPTWYHFSNSQIRAPSSELAPKKIWRIAEAYSWYQDWRWTATKNMSTKQELRTAAIRNGHFWHNALHVSIMSIRSAQMISLIDSSAMDFFGSRPKVQRCQQCPLANKYSILSRTIPRPVKRAGRLRITARIPWFRIRPWCLESFQKI